MLAGDVHRAWRALPWAEAEAIVGPGRTLILAPHPDDECLGCGGLIATLCAMGRPPRVVVLTDGTGSHPGVAADTLRSLREQETVASLRALGHGEAPIFMRLRDTAAPHAGAAFDAAVDQLVALLDGCATLCAPWRHDPHCDHVAAHLLGQAAAARTGVRHIAYPVWGWTLPDDMPLAERPPEGWRLDISGVQDRKDRAIAAHRTQQGGLAEQDPSGFVLPAHLLGALTQPYEVFVLP